MLEDPLLVRVHGFGLQLFIFFLCVSMIRNIDFRLSIWVSFVFRLDRPSQQLRLRRRGNLFYQQFAAIVIDECCVKGP